MHNTMWQADKVKIFDFKLDDTSAVHNQTELNDFIEKHTVTNVLANTYTITIRSAVFTYIRYTVFYEDYYYVPESDE